MSVDPAMQFSWPIYRHAYSTTTAAQVSTVLAEAPNDGDVVTVPELYVIGRTPDGSRGNIQLGGYTLLNNGGVCEVLMETESNNQIGAGGLAVAVLVVGSELLVRTTGIALTNIRWGLYWRAVDFPESEE